MSKGQVDAAAERYLSAKTLYIRMAILDKIVEDVAPILIAVLGIIAVLDYFIPLVNTTIPMLLLIAFTIFTLWYSEKTRRDYITAKRRYRKVRQIYENQKIKIDLSDDIVFDYNWMIS